MPVALLPAFFRHMAEHPLIRLHAAGDLGACRLSDATSMRRFRRAPLYGESFGPAAIGHQLTLGLKATPRRLTGMWFNRARRDFSGDEFLLAELLRPRRQTAEVSVRRATTRAALAGKRNFIPVLHVVASLLPPDKRRGRY